jgi:hypothetical protein
MTMLQAIRMLFLIGAVSLFPGTGAFAAEVAVNGTVASYDPVTHTITFTDGRVMTVEPASKILVDGREVAVTEVRPGSVIVLMPPSGVPGAVVPPAPRATPYSATAGSVKGTVQYVDPAAKTIIFNDGTLVQLEPNSRIFVNGKEVALAELRPGAAAVLSSPAPAVRPIPAPSPAVAPPASLSRSASPVEVSGTVASVDRQNGLITFRDGRVVRASEGDVWQHVRMSSIQPGADVLVSNAMPVGFGAAAAPSPSWAESNMMGRSPALARPGERLS